MMLAVDMTYSIYFESNDVKYFAQLGKVNGENEWHLYLNNDRIILSESDYVKSLNNESAMQDLVLKNI